MAAEAGFEGVEIMVNKRLETQDAGILKGLSAKHGVPVKCVHAPFLLMNRSVWGNYAGKIERSVDLASALGAETVVVHLPYFWHLAYARWLKNEINSFTRCNGAILAVVWLYPKRIFSMALGFLGRDKAGLSLAVNTAAAFLPAAVIGIIFGDFIKAHLFGLWPVTCALLAGGLAILAVAKRVHRGAGEGLLIESLSMRMALIIGLIQCIAMWPGVSRSLVTILGGVLVGLSVQAAVEFSFLLGLITLGAATCYEIVREGPGMMLQFGLVSPIIGIVTAFFSAVAAVKWMVAYLNRHGLEIFGYYRIVPGVCVIAPIFAGFF